MYDFPVYKSTPYFYASQRGRGVGTIFRKAGSIFKKAVKASIPVLKKRGLKSTKKVILPVLKDLGEKAVDRILAGKNVEKVMKDTAQSCMRGIKRKATEEIVNVVKRSKSKKKPKKKKLVSKKRPVTIKKLKTHPKRAIKESTMRGIFLPNKSKKPRVQKSKAKRSDLRKNLLKKLLKKKLLQ